MLRRGIRKEKSTSSEPRDHISKMAGGEDTLDTVLNKATNPANREEDWEYIMIFCDKVNKDPEGPTVAVRLLAHKLQSPQEREALFALSTLEACVKNCGRRFHAEIGKFRFLNEIIKVVSPKYLGTRTSEKVKKRCIELMYSWSKGLSHENKINEAYAMLKTQGIVKEDPVYIDKTLNVSPMPPPRPKNALFEDEEKAKLLSRLLKSKNPEDLQAANRLIKNMVQQDADRMDKISKRMSELETINNNVSVLSEMLEHYSSESATQSDTDTMKELYETLEKLRPNLFRLASDTDERDNDGISDILRANDDVMKVMNQYKMKVDGSSDLGNHSLLDLSFDQSTSSPSKQAPVNNESGTGASILDEQLLALGLSDTSDVKPALAPSLTNPSQESSSTLDQLSDIFGTSATFGNVTPSTTLLPTSGSQPPVYNLSGSNAMANMSTSSVFTGLTQTMSNSTTTTSGLLMSGSMAKPQVFSSPLSSSSSIITPMSADSLISKTSQAGTNATCQNTITDSQKKAMEELDILGQTMMQQSLSKDKSNLVSAVSSSPTPSVVSSLATTTTTSTMSTITADSTLNDLFNGTVAVGSTGSILSPSPTLLVPTSQESCADTLSIGSNSPTILPKEPISLSDVFVPLETVEPGTSPSINAYDKDGLKIVFHFAKNKPRPDVLVMVVSVMSRNSCPVKSFLFQAAVPKVMKVKLQPPSATDLPTYNPILPPAAITQVMLIANPQKEKIRLKFKITYSKDSETYSDVGEIDDFANN